MMPADGIKEIVELSAINARVQEPDGGDAFALVPPGTKAESLAKFFAPTRVTRTVQMSDAGSFSEYVNRFKDAHSLVFASVTESGARVKAILDYHEAGGEPRRCEHTAEFATVDTPEWKTWTQANRKQMDQVTFATWLEDNLPMFKEPSGADLLELVQTLEGKNNVRFTSGIRLNSGANKLDYEEDVVLRGQQSTKQESVELPRVLVVGIAPFQGAPLYRVEARLKFRIEGRKLSLWFETINPHAIVRDSVLAVVKQIEEATKIKPLLGNT